ncbi:dienelactone hydrolase family protein [Marinimicrobium sp. ABcell2]|uniref:poly(ethylene terephthalate) hydrolase family protein n=1 Tax=Marinimicrobium sp. ABcell2 TaxID=3069751 RepID=UPI0027AE57DC|nr:dienelactone hydrolase family protein [Marinimicrobium sp. ABcell2]MDQ2076935.1 dienelactone hydrolase family protein [Marinimicrobium sp. ABcell2]
MKKQHALIVLLTMFWIHPSWSEIVNSRVIENGGTGPHSAIMLTDASLPTHTLFQPEDLSEFGQDQKLPIIVWGNGACFDSPWEHVNFLNQIASHGFLVIAIGTFPEEHGEPVTARSTSSKLVDAMDWAIAQNENAESNYYQKINTDRIAVSGMSCGGLQALEVAGDPRVSALLVANSGIFNSPREGLPGIPQVDKSQLDKIHSPTLYLLGGPSDIAYDNGMDDFERINHVPVFVGNMDVGHGGTYGEPYGGEFGRVATAWFQWQLKDDQESSHLFVGDPPGLSQSSTWTFESKPVPTPE